MSYDLTQPALSSCLQLAFTKGLGKLTFGCLMEAFTSADKALQKTAVEWQQIGITEKIHRAAQTPCSQHTIHTIKTWLAQSQTHHIIGYNCPSYPPSFRELPDPPAILYARGNLSAFEHPNIAIIGSRQATPFGLKTTQKFAYELSLQGLSICSGLALGIDTCAHMGALSAKGVTVAFMGTGIDIIYPKSNQKIADTIIKENGLLVSELPLGTQPKGGNFPPRNRLICGLSTHGVIVIESKRTGGSMITARLAGEQGRDVFAVPGSIQSPLSEGCHLLIQQGAKLTQNTQDILDEINLPLLKQVIPNSTQNNLPNWDNEVNQLSPEQQKILTAMGYEIIRTEEIAKHTSFSPETLTTLLLTLELQGKIKALSGNRWQRIE